MYHIRATSNDSYGVSNYRSIGCLFDSLLRLTTKNIKGPHHCPFVKGIHPWPVDSPHKGGSNAENVSIWWRHEVLDDSSSYLSILKKVASLFTVAIVCGKWQHASKTESCHGDNFAVTGKTTIQWQNHVYFWVYCISILIWTLCYSSITGVVFLAAHRGWWSISRSSHQF